MSKEGGSMSNIEEVSRVSAEFLKNTFNLVDVKVVKAVRVDDGWEAEGEAYEESSFIKSLGLPTRVLDRNLYIVKLDENLEVQSFERKAREER
jgi:hypothetical protein